MADNENADAGGNEDAGKEQEGDAGTENNEQTVLTQKTEADAAAAKVEADAKAAKDAEAGKSKDADEGDKDKDGAPAEYADFTVPEEMGVDQTALEAFIPVAKDLNLSQDQAQKLVDVQSDLVQKHAEAQMEAWGETQKQWREDVKTDTEVGGDKMDSQVTLAKKALDKVGTPELRALLDATGTGNHVEFIRFFARVGELIGDDTMHFGGASSTEPQDAAKILFPDQN